MRPAGMSSDSDEFSNWDSDDCDYYSATLSSRKKHETAGRPGSLRSFLQQQQEGGDITHAFQKAAENSDFEALDEFLQNGVSVDCAKEGNWTALLKACWEGNIEVVRYLLDHGADPNLSKDQFTPLMACCNTNHIPEENRVECVKLLLNHGADVNGKDRHEGTALSLASSNGLLLVVNELLSTNNIDIQMKDQGEQNALFYAVQNRHRNVIERLIEAGIDKNLRNEHGYTVAEVAEAKGFHDIVALLKPHKSDETEPKDRLALISGSTLLDPVVEFLQELPDGNGDGGFATEVRNIFLGIGYSNLFDKIRFRMNLPDFLLATDEELKKAGIKLSPVRTKLLVKGIHRYHLQPWSRDSIHRFSLSENVKLQDFINYFANVAKHLAVMRATMCYSKARIERRGSGQNRAFPRARELHDLNVKTFIEAQKMKSVIIATLRNVLKMSSAGNRPADYVPTEAERNAQKWKKMKKSLWWWAAGSAAIGGAVFCYRSI